MVVIVIVLVIVIVILIVIVTSCVLTASALYKGLSRESFDTGYVAPRKLIRNT